jgi:hypothetical protein
MSEYEQTQDTYDVNLVLGKDLLETALGEHRVVDVAGRGSVVTDTLVLAGLDILRRETLDNLVLVVAKLVEPSLDDIDHLVLDGRWSC